MNTASDPANPRFAVPFPPAHGRRATSGWRRGRWAVQLAAVVVALLAASGCATSRVVTRLDPELTVFTFRRAYTNVHALVGPGGVLLVDTGEADEVDALLRDLKRAGIEPADVRAIVLTHGHGDHAGGAARLAAVTGAPVVAGRGDAARLQSGRTEGLCATDRTAQRRKAGYERATFPVVTPDRLITVETDLREVADIGIDGRVRPMPGHTEGSVVIETTKAVFVGDLLRGSIVGSRARRHFYMCDLDDNDRDVAALASSLPDSVKVVFPGHFGPLPRESIAEGFAESHARVQGP